MLACFMLNLRIYSDWGLHCPNAWHLSFHDILSNFEIPFQWMLCVMWANIPKYAGPYIQNKAHFLFHYIFHLWNDFQAVFVLLLSLERFSSILFLFAFIKCYKYCFMSRKESKSEMIKRIKKHIASQKRPIDGRVERTRIQKKRPRHTKYKELNAKLLQY